MGVHIQSLKIAGNGSNEELWCSTCNRPWGTCDRIAKPPLGPIRQLKTYTLDVVQDKFATLRDLDPNCQAEILNYLAGFCTAMVDCIEHREPTIADTYGDCLQEGYNECARRYQAYNTGR